MSYVLDALKKAELERRAEFPSAMLREEDRETLMRARRRAYWPWIGMAVFVVNGLALWTIFQQESPIEVQQEQQIQQEQQTQPDKLIQQEQQATQTTQTTQTKLIKQAKQVKQEKRTIAVEKKPEEKPVASMKTEPEQEQSSKRTRPLPTPPPNSREKPLNYQESFTGRVVGIQDGCRMEIRIEKERIESLRLAGIVCHNEREDLKRLARDVTTQMAFTRDVRVGLFFRSAGTGISADVFLPDGRLLNSLLVQAGLASILDKRFSKWEQEARQQRRGIWAKRSSSQL